ncbi:MAG: hypothetical protein ACXWLM_10070, partial [Myxococcales bacterium]
RTATGLDLTGFPNPERSQLLSDYLIAMRGQAGFGQAAALYVPFDGAIDPATVTPDSVQVVDLTTGERAPLQTKWFASSTLFLPANTLALLPLFGTPLHEGHTFALVVTGAVKGLHGEKVSAAPEMFQALRGSGPAADVTAPFRAFTVTPAGYAGDVALASVFTVQDPTQTLLKLRAAVRATPEPAPTALSCADQSGAAVLCTGEFPVPNFQSGTPPYLSSGGALVLAADGTPIVQRTESVRFAMSLPEGAGPFPVVLYEHGTGGDYESFWREGLGADMAARGIAMLSMDQVLHGPRNPGCWPPPADTETCVGTAYFNFINPYAGRDNTRQGAADGFQLLRLAFALPQLDAGRIAFLGHSQGGLTGAPFVAAEPQLKAAAMSGTGGILAITVLVRKDPLDFKAVAELLLGIQGKEELEPFHPVLMVIQTFGEPADPISYGRHFARDPLGGGGRAVLLTEGLLDPYTSSQASEALGAAALFDIGGTAAHESDAFVKLGLSVDALPQAVVPGGGLLLQFPNDGHYAIFDNPVARCRVETFLETALAGAARVDPCGG